MQHIKKFKDFAVKKKNCKPNPPMVGQIQNQKVSNNDVKNRAHVHFHKNTNESRKSYWEIL